MFFRPQTQLALWVRAAAFWFAGLTVGLLFSDGFRHDIDPIALPVIAVFMLLPLALVGTWATADAELPGWSAGRVLLHWIVLPAATLSTFAMAGIVALMVIASQVVTLTLLTGIWAVRRGVPKALMAPRW